MKIKTTNSSRQANALMQLTRNTANNNGYLGSIPSDDVTAAFLSASSLVYQIIKNTTGGGGMTMFSDTKKGESKISSDGLTTLGSIISSLGPDSVTYKNFMRSIHMGADRVSKEAGDGTSSFIYLSALFYMNLVTNKIEKSYNSQKLVAILDDIFEDYKKEAMAKAASHKIKSRDIFHAIRIVLNNDKYLTDTVVAALRSQTNLIQDDKICGGISSNHVILNKEDANDEDMTVKFIQDQHRIVKSNNTSNISISLFQDFERSFLDDTIKNNRFIHATNPTEMIIGDKVGEGSVIICSVDFEKMPAQDDHLAAVSSLNSFFKFLKDTFTMNANDTLCVLGINYNDPMSNNIPIAQNSDLLTNPNNYSGDSSDTSVMRNNVLFIPLDRSEIKENMDLIIQSIGGDVQTLTYPDHDPKGQYGGFSNEGIDLLRNQIKQEEKRFTSKTFSENKVSKIYVKRKSVSFKPLDDLSKPFDKMITDKINTIKSNTELAVADIKSTMSKEEFNEIMTSANLSIMSSGERDLKTKKLLLDMLNPEVNYRMVVTCYSERAYSRIEDLMEDFQIMFGNLKSGLVEGSVLNAFDICLNILLPRYMKDNKNDMRVKIITIFLDTLKELIITTKNNFTHELTQPYEVEIKDIMNPKSKHFSNKNFDPSMQKMVKGRPVKVPVPVFNEIFLIKSVFDVIKTHIVIKVVPSEIPYTIRNLDLLRQLQGDEDLLLSLDLVDYNKRDIQNNDIIYMNVSDLTDKNIDKMKSTKSKILRNPDRLYNIHLQEIDFISLNKKNKVGGKNRRK